MSNKYGEVEYLGKVLKLTQHAYLETRCNEDTSYFASATDEDDNDYDVKWRILDKFWNDDKERYDLPEDESESCDWKIYKVRKL